MSKKKKKTSAPTAQHFEFARNLWSEGSASAAGRKTWPDLKAAEAKGVKWAARADVKVAVEAVREMMQDQIRAEFISRGCGMGRIIGLTVKRLEDTDTAAREFKELAMWAADLMGYSPKKASKERPASGNALALIVHDSGTGRTALASGLPDSRFPDVRAVFPEDKNEGAGHTAVRALAASRADVAGPSGPDSSG